MSNKTRPDVKLPILKPENYIEWKIKITSLLKSRNLFDLVRGELAEKDDSYERDNEEAKTIIYNTLDGKTTQAAGVCEHAYQLWSKLRSNFEGSKDDITGIALAKFMDLTKKREEKLSDFLGRYEIVLGNLTETGLIVDIAIALYVLTKSLPRHIKDGIRNWRAVDDKKNINQILSYIRATYRDEDVAESNNSAAFLNVSRSKSNWKNKNRPPYSNKRVNQNGGDKRTDENKNNTCTYCKKQGHGWRDCYKLKRDNENKRNSQQAHMALERSIQTYQQYLPEDNKYRWIIDSGATSHMTHIRDLLLNYKEFVEPELILVGDGEHIEALGKGWLFIQGNKGPRVLKDVLFVPMMTANLFSVKSALRDGYSIRFQNNTVIVKDKNETIPAHFDGCLFTIHLKILNHNPRTTGKALTAYPIETWHKRLGHCGIDLIKRMKKQNMVEGLEIGSSPYRCEDCMQGKSCRKSHPSRKQILATDELAILHFDTVDTSVESLGGKRYFVLATEEYSGYKLIDFVAKKSEITNCVKMMINSVKLNSKRPVVCIYSDNGTEFVNSELRNWLFDRGIMHELSSAYNAEQNGRAEAANKAVINAARTSLIASRLPKELWAEACSAAVYVQNRLPSIEKPSETRYQLYFRHKPDIKNLHIFGEKVLRLIPKQLRKNKMDPVAKPCRFVGYTSRFNTFRLYDEVNNRIIIDCNVRFTDCIPDGTLTDADESEDYTTIRWESNNQQTRSANNTNESQGFITNTDQGTDDDTIIYPNTNSIQEETQSEESNNRQDNVNDEIHAEILERSGQPPINSQSGRRTRLQSGSLIPIYYGDRNKTGLPYPVRRENISLYSLNDEPQTIKEAKESKDWDKWQAAMQEEIQALEENNTWTIVDKPPKIRPIKSKWIFKLKLKPDGSVEKYKARLVAKGYSQIPDIDYKLTFAPVASMTTVRMMLAIAVQHQMEIVQFDIKTAFLYGDLEEELYMECPEYYDAPNGKVCKLAKSLYGLKQAPRQWHKKFDSFLKKFKLILSNYDRCLYYSEDRKIFLTIYVDDGLIIAETKALALQLINYLKEYLVVKTMDCKAYLGLEILRENKALLIIQRQYINKTLDKFNMSNCKPSSTPEEVGQIDFKNSPRLTDNFPFKELVGCLLYLVTCTRPDIAHAVSIASRTSEPTEAHWACLKRILRYLKGTIDLSLRFAQEDNPQLTGYSDADYANDTETRRSTSGFVIYWGNSPIVWKCQRQSLVTLSTTEAEYIAGTELVKKLIPLKAMMTELRLINDKPIQIYIDNKSTVNIVKNEQSQDRTKHIDVRHKWLNEHHDAGNIEISHISGDEQRADLLTKPLHKTKFSANRNWFLHTITVMACVAALASHCYTIMLKPTNPVDYVSSDLKYVKKLQRFRCKVIIMNPCETYFTNITSNEKINKRLIHDCEESFNRIARLDYCTSSKNRSKRSIDYRDGPGEFTSSHKNRELMSRNPVKHFEIEKTPEATNSLALYREKRLIPLLAVVGLIVVTGMQVSTSIQTDVNISNINELLKATQEERKFLQTGYEYMKETRDTIHAINYRISHIEERLDTIDRTLEQFPKIVALVNHYYNNFKELLDNLADIDNAALHNRASTAIFRIAKENKLLDQKDDNMQLEKCEEDISNQNKHFTFNYQFLMQQTDPKIKIMKAAAIMFWNHTETNKWCWMKYVSAKNVMVNVTNNCQQEVQDHWITEKTVSGYSCLKENKQLEPANHLYHTDICRDNFKPSTKDIQVKLFNGFYKIYCHGHPITIGTKQSICGEGVYELPISERFELNGEIYDLGEVSTIQINAVELHINRQIAEQLRTDKVRIYGVNMTNLDNNFDRLSRLTDSIWRNVTLVESPINNWIFNKVKSIGKCFSDIVSGFGNILSIVFIIGTIILIFPILEILLIVWKIGYTMFSTLASPIQRLSTRLRSTRLRKQPMRKIRKYLTQD